MRQQRSVSARLLVACAAVALAATAGCKSSGSMTQRKSRGEDPLLSPSACVDECRPASARGRGRGSPQTRNDTPTNAELASEYYPPTDPAPADARPAGLELRPPQWTPTSAVKRVSGATPAAGGVVLDFDQGQALLQGRGAGEFRLDRGEGGEWEFSCHVAATGRRYVAHNRDYLAAMQSVLDQIDRDGR